ncbi:unnamed protein product [Schistosoma margrebowiei]|uniref:PEHE domain-containing protein n=3 Tax=Schistosoma margrebowiei TaxID=48269 RepID=A0AA85AN98_9TREM|nr:unnamed protein product [Schistosoma margrebowiei]
MVTAVQPMFGLLKRLHLHPMENALNELGPQTSLLQSIKFKAQPFLFRKTKSEEIRRNHDSMGQKRPSTYLSNTDLKTAKRSRRVTKLTDKIVNSVDVNFKPNYENSSISYSTLSPGVTPSNPPIFPSPTSINSPNLSVSNVSYSLRIPNSSETPVISHPKYLCLQNSPHPVCQYRSQVTPVVRTNPTEYQTRISTRSTDSLLDENHFVTEEEIPANSICAKDSLHLNKITGHLSGQNPKDVRYLSRSRNTSRLSPVSSVSKRYDNSDDNKCDVKLRNKDKVMIVHKEPPKRRKSIDQLIEPSIHGLPDPEMSTKPRARKPTQFLQLNAQTTEPSCNDRKPAYLTTQSYYYVPDFTNRHPQSPETVQGHVMEPRGIPKMSNSAVLIEVPSWRVIPIPGVDIYTDCSCGAKHCKSCPKKHPDRRKLTDTDTLKPCNLRALRSSLLTINSVHSNKNYPTSELKSKPRSRSSQTQKEHYQVGEPIKSVGVLDENISDPAFLARHSRLEIEEVRHERLSRQRTAEQELKQRLEERDQASWHKRQPGRLDPLLKYRPASRMPTQLSYALKQGHQFHVDNSIPVVAFGCRVPLASLKPFTKFSIQ